MREILFRGKRIDNGEWQTGDLLRFQDSTVIHAYIDGFRTAFEVDPDTVGQYTGLTDQNGKRIFEGDLLRLWSDHHGCLVGEASEVKYGSFNCPCCHGVYGWCCDDRGDIRDYYGCVVIGNIHDNPELMEDEE